MESSRTNVGQVSLDEFVQVVAKIYRAHDKHRSIWDVWCHTLHHAAGIAQRVRIGANQNKLYEEIADFSLWLFTVVLKLRGKFGQSEGGTESTQESFIRIENSCSDLLWHKYPGLCPHCAGREIAGDGGTVSLGVLPCECLGRAPEAEERSAKRKRLLEVHEYSYRAHDEKPTSIDGWQRMFGAIFARNVASLSQTQIALHLMEEIGEASDAMIRVYTYKEETFLSGEPNWRQMNLEGQLADIFSWLFALVEKINQLKGEGSKSEVAASIHLSEIIWRRYGSEGLRSFFCPFCKQTICCCRIILVPGTRSVEELLQKFQRS